MACTTIQTATPRIGRAAGLLGLAAFLAQGLGAVEPLRVAPGGVVRWPGQDVSGCAQQGESFEPIGGACWYAVDLLAPEGPLELERTRAGVKELRRVMVGDYPYPVQRLDVEERMVHLSDADLARVARENRRIAAAFQTRGPRRFELPLAAPLERMSGGSRFGARRYFNGEPRSPHSGADYKASTGTPVFAVARGEVVLAEEHFFAGKSVFIDHGDGLISMSFHLSAIAVEPGDTVERGQRVGAVGATGRVTGAHLHFALRWRGARVNPALLLANAEVPAL